MVTVGAAVAVVSGLVGIVPFPFMLMSPYAHDCAVPPPGFRLKLENQSCVEELRTIVR